MSVERVSHDVTAHDNAVLEILQYSNITLGLFLIPGLDKRLLQILVHFKSERLTTHHSMILLNV
jgi:hypothetical protein